MRYDTLKNLFVIQATGPKYKILPYVFNTNLKPGIYTIKTVFNAANTVREISIVIKQIIRSIEFKHLLSDLPIVIMQILQIYKYLIIK